MLREVCDKPIVGGVNGVAAGAGLSLAMACDMRIGAERLRLIAGYPRIGGSPDGGLTWTLPQAIGYEQAMRFLLENRTVDARGGAAPRLRRRSRAGRAVRRAARRVLRVPRRTLADREPPDEARHRAGDDAIDLESQVRYELANIRRAFATKDAEEAREAFFEKRPPVFHGR